jgi:type IV pilus assembly protein PilA
MKKVKINNKGFSLVELIIVIAIMAILAAALAPQLIKYIDNSRKSTDVSTGQSIATAVSVALANEDAYDAALTKIAAATTYTYWVSDCYSAATLDDFQTKVKEIIGGTTTPTPKFRGSVGTNKYDDFAIVLLKDGTNVSFEIYPANATAFAPTGANADDIVYPTVGTNYAD